MKIELFTEVNFRGPTAKNGKCIALVECETKKGPAVKAQTETEQNTTYHRMSMIEQLKLDGVCNNENCVDCQYYGECVAGEKREELALDKAIEIVERGGRDEE